MRRYLTFVAVALVGCSTASRQPATTYQFTLASVERQERGGESLEFTPTDTNTFEDDYLKVVWQPQTTQLQFTLTNKTASSMRVLWDDASFVGIDGFGDRIMHRGIKFADRSASMPPTLIVHGGTIEDLVAPASNVYWREGIGSFDVGGWESHTLVSSGGGAAYAPPSDGRVIKVLLPLETSSRVQEYLFTFDLQARREVEIRIVRKRAEIQNCRLLGMIEANPPYIWPGDDFKQLRMKAWPLGADTILVPGSRIGTVEGEAYRCAGE